MLSNNYVFRLHHSHMLFSFLLKQQWHFVEHKNNNAGVMVGVEKRTHFKPFFVNCFQTKIKQSLAPQEKQHCFQSWQDATVLDTIANIESILHVVSKLKGCLMFYIKWNAWIGDFN